VSYDFGLRVDTGNRDGDVIIDAEHLEQPSVRCSNYTSNAWRMYAEAGIRLPELDGLWCGDLVWRLADAVKQMETDPGRFQPLEPENGWGDYEGALNYLRSILDVCEAHPQARLYISS
jgi:hypothetical protein